MAPRPLQHRGEIPVTSPRRYILGTHVSGPSLVLELLSPLNSHLWRLFPSHCTRPECGSRPLSLILLIPLTGDVGVAGIHCFVSPSSWSKYPQLLRAITSPLVKADTLGQCQFPVEPGQAEAGSLAFQSGVEQLQLISGGAGRPDQQSCLLSPDL